MKNKIILLLGLFSFINSCKKNNSTSGNAALNVILATLDVPSVYVYFTNSPSNYFLQQTPIVNPSSAEFGLTSGSTPISIISSADTNKSLFKGTFNLKPSGIYSFYLAGQAPKLDTLFMQDFIPIIKDSTVGVRFINLSPGSLPISVNLQGNDLSLFEFSNLGYMQISEFRNYSAGANATKNYTFEIRDQASGYLLTTFIWSYTLHKNNTLVITGSESSLSQESIAVFQVNNY